MEAYKISDQTPFHSVPEEPKVNEKCSAESNGLVQMSGAIDE